MSGPIKIGAAGLDSSHCVSFTEMLNDPRHVHHVPGGRVTAAYRGGSPDIELSSGRIDGFTETLVDRHGVRLVDRLGLLAEQVDAILLTSVDGRIHREQFAELAPYGKPIFVDKPLAVSTQDARSMVELAAASGVPFMSSSSLRYSEGLRDACLATDGGSITGVDCFGPLKLEPAMPGLFWYGVHQVEMLYAVLGPGCVEVTASASGEHDVVTGVWRDGRIGMLRGNRTGNNKYGCLIHRESGTRYVDISQDRKPYYAHLLEAILEMFHTGNAPITGEEMIEVVRFMEAANTSRETGRTVQL